MTQGWIPTHDGQRTECGVVRDPYIRNSDSYGPITAYFPFFETERGARAWCAAVGAIPLASDRAEADRIAESHDAELQEC